MKLIKFAELPVLLKVYAQTIMATDSLEQSKEDQKETALAALKDALNGEKCIVAVSNHHFIQFDVNPQQHPEFSARCIQHQRKSTRLAAMLIPLVLAVRAAVAGARSEWPLSFF